MGLQAPNMSLNFPGGGSDYSSLLGFGNTGYAPTTDFLNSANIALPTQTGAVGTGALAVGRPDFLSWDGLLGGTNADGTKSNGWGSAALGLIQGLGGAYMGMKQYGLAKEQLQFSKDAFNKNYEAQKSMTNASMEDRQRARVASNAGAYQSVGDYMAKNGIK